MTATNLPSSVSATPRQEAQLFAAVSSTQELDALESNGVKTVLVEDASRFARKVIVQELGIVTLIARKVGCWSAAGDLELTNTDDEFKVAMRQIAAAFAQLEKARLVKKLKAARDRKRAAGEKVEGRKSIAETKPKTVELAHKLARARPKGGKRSLREISAELAAEQSRDQEARARLSMTIARSGPTNGHRRAVP